MSSPALTLPPATALPARPTPRDVTRKDPALLRAHAAMASMLQHGLMPTPANYLIWYNYHSGGTPGLRPSLDACLAEFTALGQRIPQARMEALHAEYFSGGRAADSLQEVAARLEGAVHEAANLVNHAREDALRYGGTLDQAQSRMSDPPDSVAKLLRRLVAETREASARSEAAAHNLAETSRKTAALQAELAEARHQASTDPLTGVANRRRLDEALATALSGARAGREAVALVMLDVDHFKVVNDSHGHPAGDQVLKEMARTLSGVAGGDGGDGSGGAALVARFGGEEFAALTLAGNMRDVVRLAERFRVQISQASVLVPQTGHRISVTASLGIAVAQPGETGAQLIERADAALYEAKRTGRNRICCDPPLTKAEAVWN